MIQIPELELLVNLHRETNLRSSMNLKDIIEKAWDNRELLKEQETITAINAVIEELDKGRLRVAEPLAEG